MDKFRKFYSDFVLLMLVVGEILVMLFALFAAPSAVNDYGYYSDSLDLPMFEGSAGTVFNWFSWVIEPVKEGSLVDNTASSLLAIFIFLVILLVGILCVYNIYKYHHSSEKDGKYPCGSIVVGTVIGIYLVTYSIMVVCSGGMILD